MNQLIKQLAEQAEDTLTWKEFGDDGYSEITRTRQQVNLEEFAKLIIQECIEAHVDNYGIDIISEAVYRRFGFDE